MKWNWGWNIVAALVLFMTMIVVMVVKSVNTKVDLVAQDYYADEIAYQDRIDKEANAKALSGHFTWQRTEKGIALVFPEDFNAGDFVGKIQLYRPSDKKLDRTFEVEGIQDQQYTISKENLIPGKWEVQVEGESEGKAYYFEQIVNL
ncbi:FixH family protein [Cryomorphaceae bacterium]|nr:FixH family protein [Cryomorphaceae bacterium]